MKTKHPLKSQTMLAAYVTIIVGLLQYFGIIGPEQKVNITIDQLDKPPAQSVQEKAAPIALLGAGAMAAKGRRDAKSNIGPLIGGKDEGEET